MWLAGAAAIVVCALPSTVLAHRCTGDCNGSDTVSVDELVNGVRIALNQLPLGTCYAFDVDLDDRVSINELQVAVNNVFSFCGHGAPPTPSDTPTPTPEPTGAGDATPSPTPTSELDGI